MEERTYKGVPLSDLNIDEIDWSDEVAEHIRTRSERTGPGDWDIEPEWATEAALDASRVVSLAGSTNPDRIALKIIGMANIDGEPILLKVWVWSDEPASSEVWNGGSASLANRSDLRRYREGGAT